MKRTAEKVLSIISAVFTFITIVMGIVGISMWKNFSSNPTWRREAEMELLSDPEFTQADVDMIFSILGFLEGFGWFIIILYVISFLLTIIGIINIWNNKKPKLAGIMFIIAGVLGGILSLVSILLYIAGILCFTRKPPMSSEGSFIEDNYDNTMRPL